MSSEITIILPDSIDAAQLRQLSEAGFCIHDQENRYPEKKSSRNSNMNFIYIDLETTVGSKEPIEVALVGLDGNLLFSSIVQPTNYTGDAYAKKGLPDEVLKKAPTKEECEDSIKRLIEGNHVVGWNLEHDMNSWPTIFSSAAVTHCAMKRFDPYRGEYNYKYGNYHYTKLREAAELCGLSFTEQGHHRAYADALMCQKIWNWMTENPIGNFNKFIPQQITQTSNIVHLTK